MNSYPKPARHCGVNAAACESVFNCNRRASSPRITIANVSSKPSGGPIVSPNRLS